MLVSRAVELRAEGLSWLSDFWIEVVMFWDIGFMPGMICDGKRPCRLECQKASWT